MTTFTVTVMSTAAARLGGGVDKAARTAAADLGLTLEPLGGGAVIGAPAGTLAADTGFHVTTTKATAKRLAAAIEVSITPSQVLYEQMWEGRP